VIAAPKYQINHKFIDRSIDQWLSIHFGDLSFNGRVFIGHRKRGGGVYTMTARSLTELRPYVLMVHASQRLDYYITANTVNGTQRNLDGLFGLQNIVIDVDCHDPEADAPALVQAFLWRAQRDLWNTDAIPCPNSIVRTGRGVQLWWAIKPCHASCRFYYDKIKTTIMDHVGAMLAEYSELDGLEVDRAASSNPVGYYRLPCTYNTTAGKYGTLQILRTERYDTHELAELAGPELDVIDEKHDRIHVPMQDTDIIVLHNYYSVGLNRVMQLIKLRNLRDNEVGRETRNNLCFAVYNSLRMSFDHDEAMERLWAYNAGFKSPMTERELEHTICAAKRKGGYKYSNAKLIELLDITLEEQNAIGLHPFTGQYRPWSHSKPNASRDAARKALRDDRDHKVISMYQNGISQAETARQLGISRNTVARILKDWTAQNDIETARENLLKNGSIYDCLIVRREAAVSLEDGQSSPLPFQTVVLHPGLGHGPPDDS